MKQVATAPSFQPSPSPFDIRIAQAPLQQQAGLESFFAGMPSQDRAAVGRGSFKGGSQMGDGSRDGGNGSRAGKSFRSMSEYSEEVIAPTFWGAVKTIYETTTSVWNGGFGFVCNAAGFLFGGSITMAFALWCILNLLNKLSVLAYLTSFLPEAVLRDFVANANLTAICPVCDSCPSCFENRM